MTISSHKKVPDVGVDIGVIYILSGVTTHRATGANLDSIISQISNSKISSFYLASVTAQADLCLS